MGYDNDNESPGARARRETGISPMESQRKVSSQIAFIKKDIFKINITIYCLALEEVAQVYFTMERG